MKENTLKTLYFSFVYPYLHYGIIAWGSTTANYLNPLQIIQKRVIRILSSASRIAHTAPLFKKLGLLRIKDIYILNVMLFMFKLKHAMLPVIFNSMFILNKNIHTYFTRQMGDYHIPAWRLQTRKRSICVQGPLIWNKLIEKFNIEVMITTFKFKVKRFLIENEVHL